MQKERLKNKQRMENHFSVRFRLRRSQKKILRLAKKSSRNRSKHVSSELHDRSSIEIVLYYCVRSRLYEHHQRNEEEEL